jgi:hypothetical protein
LFVLEQGAAAIRAGRAAEAEAILTRGLVALDADTRPKLPGERALWFYKRGLARLNQNHPPDATVDLRAALSSSPQAWVEAGRAWRWARSPIWPAIAPTPSRSTQKRNPSAVTSTRCAPRFAQILKQPFSFERR